MLLLLRHFSRRVLQKITITDSVLAQTLPPTTRPSQGLVKGSSRPGSVYLCVLTATKKPIPVASISHRRGHLPPRTVIYDTAEMYQDVLSQGIKEITQRYSKP